MRRAAAILAAALALGVAASPAGAANTPGSAPRDPNALISPKTEDRPPAGYRRSAIQVIAIARRVPKIADVLRRHPGYTRDAYLKGANRWQVSFFEKSEPGEARKEIGQVLIWDPTGNVLEAWTGFQVPWSMARGYPGAFGRKANALYLWLPLSLLFLVPFVTPRRPFRLLHLDLLVLLGFSVSLAYFNRRQHRRLGHRRLPPARVPAGADAVRRPPTARAARRRAPARPRVVAGDSPRVPARLPLGPEPL